MDSQPYLDQIREGGGVTCKENRKCGPRPRHCTKPDYTPGGGGFGFVLIGAFILWLLGCSGVLSLFF